MALYGAILHLLDSRRDGTGEIAVRQVLARGMPLFRSARKCAPCLKFSPNPNLGKSLGLPK